MLGSLWREMLTAQTPRGVDTSFDRFWWAAGMTSMTEIRRKAVITRWPTQAGFEP
jgi:hypothetical protein